MTSHPCVSTGSADLDRLVRHGGLPLGSIMCVEESGTTDFASILLRSFAALGVLQSRSEKSIVIAVGVNPHWGRDLPGIYKDKKKVAAKQIEEEKEKLSVENLAAGSSTPGVRTDMKIAWRYARTAPQSQAGSVQQPSGSPLYAPELDYTTRLIPSANTQELVVAPMAPSLAGILEFLEQKVSAAVADDSIVRIVMPSLLHPTVFPPVMAQAKEILPFFHGLRNLCRRFPSNICVLVSLPTELYPRDGLLTRWIEDISDGVVQLEGFPEGYASLSQTKEYQGFVHIHKIPFASERGSMERRVGEYAFRVGRRKFEIHEWGIPVEETEEPKKESVDF